ncbi:MAG: hypothetical protein K8R99_07335 [Actinomycetia bacterium]|nr:hypothetical protein [Actinomycetes bacterium]
MSDGWQVKDVVGDAGEFHATDPSPVRAAVFHMVTKPTLVLGSAQRNTDVEPRVARALAIEVVKRRSGGGAVLLIPEEFVWLDLVIPAGDALWHDDVGRAMVWVGELWQRALGDLGLATEVHIAATIESRWARQVCFGGVGRGEVLAVDRNADRHVDRKVVGVSQRRTRAFARFQSLGHLRWRPEFVAALVAPPRPAATELAARVATVAAPASAIREALVRNLPSAGGVISR